MVSRQGYFGGTQTSLPSSTVSAALCVVSVHRQSHRQVPDDQRKPTIINLNSTGKTFCTFILFHPRVMFCESADRLSVVGCIRRRRIRFAA